MIKENQPIKSDESQKSKKSVVQTAYKLAENAKHKKGVDGGFVDRKKMSEL